MKESQIRRHLNFICFVQETEGYPMSEKDTEYARSVLENDMSADDAVADIIDSHGLSMVSDQIESIDGCYPDSDCYINYFGIREQDLLDRVETAIVSVRMAQILTDHQQWSFDFEHLKTLHAILFDDLYPFAGKIRRIPITKQTVFCLPQYIESMAQDIFSKLRDSQYLRNEEFGEFVDNLAYFMAEVHALHPFLDGNTRAMRLFFQQLSQAAGWQINPLQMDHSRLLEADIAALEGDYQPLIAILHQAVEPL